MSFHAEPVDSPAGRKKALFATPRKLPPASVLEGRVVVLDLAFAGGPKQFRKVTERFIEGLGERLAAWVDHHGHERHGDFASDPRFVLSTKREHPSCAEMVTPGLVSSVGPIDSLVTHGDLDGILAAAKWLLGGEEPYAGADRDARAADTRQGRLGPVGRLVDEGLRGLPSDEALRHEVLQSLVSYGGLSETVSARLQGGVAAFQQRVRAAAERARGYRVIGRLAVVELPEGDRDFDKTKLLLMGQELAPVAVVRQGPNVTVASAFDSEWNLVEILGLEGGMPTRVSVTTKHFEELLDRLNRSLGAFSISRPSGLSGNESLP